MYEASPEVSPFASKFDYALANPDKQVLTADEVAGWNLFRGTGMCNTCHLDGTENTLKQRNPAPIATANAACSPTSPPTTSDSPETRKLLITPKIIPISTAMLQSGRR